MIDTIFNIVMGSMDRSIPQAECGELRTQLYLAEKLGYITSENANQLINKTRKISLMLYNLIKTRKEKF